MEKEVICCGVIGYGPAFNMGRAHCDYISQTERLKLTAVCDLDPKCTQAAEADFPDIQTFNQVSEMLENGGIDLAVVVTPHNTHRDLTVQCLKASKHVVVEKPMCLTAEEATAMIKAAEQAGQMLSVFHNRRHDGDFLAIKEVVDKGLIGEVFHIEAGGGSYRHPGYWWRSDKRVSGGAFYDWGAHIIDWVLHLVPAKMASVTGFFHKLVWHDVTNEDHVEAMIRFKNGTVADVQLSNIARVPRARWRILGTKGAILDQGGEECFTVNTEIDGMSVEMKVDYKKGNWELYYQGIAKHLLEREPLEVTPESARRVIAVMETAEKSAQSGQSESVPYE